MYTATAQIDVSRPIGRRFAKYPKKVEVEYPSPIGMSGIGYTIDEVMDKVYAKLNTHYGCDLRNL